jgi:MFS family permease
VSQPVTARSGERPDAIDPRGAFARRTAWFVVGTVFAYGLFGNMTGGVIGIIQPILIQQVHFSAAQIGNVTSAVAWLGVPFSIIGGWLADRLGPRLLGLVTVVIMTVATFTFPSISTVGQFFVNRAGIAVGSGPVVPVGNRAVVKSARRDTIGVSAALLNITYPAAQLVLTAAGAAVITALGWHAWIYILGGYGVATLILWSIAVRRLPADRGDTDGQPAPTEPPAASDPAPRAAASRLSGRQLLDLFGSRTLLSCGLAWGASAYAFVLLAFYLPLFYVSVYHEDLLTAGLRSTAPWIGGCVAGLGVGFLTDRLMRRYRNYRIARSYVAAAGQITFGAALLIAYFSHNLTVAYVMFFVGEFGNEIGATLFQVTNMDTVPRRSGSTTGWTWAFVLAGSSACAYFTGHLITGGHWATAFIIAGVLPIVGGLLVLGWMYPGQLFRWTDRRSHVRAASRNLFPGND